MDDGRQRRREVEARQIERRARLLARYGLGIDEPHRLAHKLRCCRRGCLYCRLEADRRSVLRTERRLVLDDDDRAALGAHATDRLSRLRTRRRHRQVP
ncbi:MAG: hypothetical protein HZB16_16805 [Armatimonadetes bacterium]|nr:hypothetical protein [Armatimonadota bacterium]